MPTLDRHASTMKEHTMIKKYNNAYLHLLSKCLLCLVILPASCIQQNNRISPPQPNLPPIPFHQIQTDTLFDSPQNISILTIPKTDTNRYHFDLAHHSDTLMTTSQFAKKENALAAINGGFFNMDQGGSVTYLEENDSIYQQNIPHGEKWAIANWAKTGAIIIQKNGQLKIESAKASSFYEQSQLETSVLITGPFLIENGEKIELIGAKFVKDRHPRTCICETKDSHLLLTIDGRQAEAKGMSLLEVQDFLLTQKCITAINLDGGGSTTMWIKEAGVVNSPSDLFGERKVANAILVKAKLGY